MDRTHFVSPARQTQAAVAAMRNVPLRVALLALAVFAGASFTALPGQGPPGSTLAANQVQTVTLQQQESFDFETGEVDSLAGGHLYYLDDGLPRFWANNEPQAGVAHIGPAGGRPLEQVFPPVSGYTRFGVIAEPDHFYAALPKAGAGGPHAVFRVVSIGELSVTIEYRLVTPSPRFVPLLATDSAIPDLGVPSLEVLGVQCEPGPVAGACHGEFPSLALRIAAAATYNNDGSHSKVMLTATILWSNGTCLIDVSEAVPAEVGHDRIAVLEAAATLTSPDVCSQPTATDTIYGVRVCIERDGDLDPRIHCRDFPFELAVTFVRQ